MKPATVASILQSIERQWPLAADCEITLEANPTSVEAGNFRGYRTAGVNRVSLGVQALDDAQLKALGRLHTADEALKAVAIAKAAFPRVSFDLIYARPDQTPAAWRAELMRAIDGGRRASFALSAHHRGRDALRCAASRGKAQGPRRGSSAGAVGCDARNLRCRGSSGLRNLEPRPARGGVAAQSGLLALRRICRRRPRCARPHRSGKRALRH